MSEKKEKYKIEKKWKPTIKKWVKALRSGKYKQAEKALSKYDVDADGNYIEEPVGYCCLGVLGKLQKCTWQKSDGLLAHDGDNFVEGLENIPEQLQGEGRLVNKLTAMNDGFNGEKKRGFRGIAQFIERNIEFV